MEKKNGKKVEHKTPSSLSYAIDMLTRTSACAKLTAVSNRSAFVRKLLLQDPKVTERFHWLEDARAVMKHAANLVAASTPDKAVAIRKCAMPVLMNLMDLLKRNCECKSWKMTVSLPSCDLATLYKDGKEFDRLVNSMLIAVDLYYEMTEEVKRKERQVQSDNIEKMAALERADRKKYEEEEAELVRNVARAKVFRGRMTELLEQATRKDAAELFLAPPGVTGKNTVACFIEIEKETIDFVAKTGMTGDLDKALEEFMLRKNRRFPPPPPVVYEPCSACRDEGWNCYQCGRYTCM